MNKKLGDILFENRLYSYQNLIKDEIWDGLKMLCIARLWIQCPECATPDDSFCSRFAPTSGA